MADNHQDFLNSIGSADKYGFSYPDDSEFSSQKGLDEKVVRQISAYKEEPEWMLDFRLKAYQHYRKRPIPPGARI